jgi:type II secretory pathway component PulK
MQAAALRRTRNVQHGRRGAALLLAVLLLLVLVAIVFQINVSTSTQARVGRNEIGLATMDMAIESALLELSDKLKIDGESASDSQGSQPPGGGALGGSPAAGPATGGGQGQGSGDSASACDSRRDEWARPARTEINEIKLRILIQDEDSKLNVLGMLASDEKEAKAAFDRVVRVLDLCREGTRMDIDSSDAEEMAQAMLDYMTKGAADLTRPKQLSANPEHTDQRLPRSLREFQILAPFEPQHFRDCRDEDGVRVHSIESFLTVWSSVVVVKDSPTASAALASAQGKSGSSANSGSSSSGSRTGSSSASKSNSSSSGQKSGSSSSQTGTGQSGAGSASSTQGGTAPAGGGQSGTGAAGQTDGGLGGGTQGGSASPGGWQVNINTAPVAVLKSLFDDREVPQRFWDEVVEYRNLPEKETEETTGDSDATEEEAEPMLDEFGREIVEYRIFESLQELEEVEGYGDLAAEAKTKIQSLLTVTSNVFTVHVIARRVTGEEDESVLLDDPRSIEEAEEKGNALVRVVRSVLWRHKDAEENMVITPILRWEVLDTVPVEVLDYPEEDR